MRVLVIIPAYNESCNIKNVVQALNQTVPEADYIIVNDCSKDNTEQVCKENHFNYISLPINLGIGGGVQTGYVYAKENNYDIAVQMDGDGQHDPKYLREVIRPIIEDKADIVIGSRFINNEGFQSSGARRFGIVFLSRLIKLCCHVKIKDVTSGYRAVNRKYIEMYSRDYAQDYPEPEAIIAAAMNQAKIEEVPVVMKERLGGRSSINAWRPMYYMFKVSLSILLYRVTFDEKG